jgi:hypothetical protein
MLLLLLLASCASDEPPKPVLVLYALDRPEKLPFLDPNSSEVAVLRGTISISETGILAQPRRVYVDAPQGTKFITLVKIDAGRFDGYVPTGNDIDRSMNAIKEWAAQAESTSLEIDFDAGTAQRPFYRTLLKNLRSAFQRLTIGAPASWCTSDPWVKDLPVDEVIPTLFRMGPKGGAVMDNLTGAGDFTPDICKGHYSISADEKLSFRPPVRRLYAFNPQSWDEKTYRSLLELLPK